MKKGISAVKYIRNNKRTCFVLIIAFALTIMVMYVINFLLSATKESFKTIMLEMPKKVMYANLSDAAYGINEEDFATHEEYVDKYQETVEETENKMRALDGVKFVKRAQKIDTKYAGIIGMVVYETPLLEKEEIKGYIDHFNAKLIDGKMPEEPGDILVDKNVFANRHYEIGGYYMKEFYGETFKVCGVIESDYMICVGMPNGFTNSGWYTVICIDEPITQFKDIAEKLDLNISETEDIIDANDYRAFYDDDVVKSIDSSMDIIILVVMIFLAISVIVAYVSFMRNRVSEYCLYSSIGYSKKSIYAMMMREMIIIFGTGIIIGAMIAGVIVIFLNKTAVEPMGLIGKLVDLNQISKIMTAIICIIGLLQIPAVMTINSIKTIDMIED
jgi:ABC-type lipoprotein release transport system permease subunit